MERKPIDPRKFCVAPTTIWAEQWFLLSAKDPELGRVNTMTVAWGSFGCMWSKPFAMAVVRPSRYTYELMEKSGSFSLCAFPPEFKKKLSICGSNSGRTMDKVKECGLTVLSLPDTGAPAFEEAELIIECRKMYFDDFKPANFLLPEIESNYKGRDYHRMYFGEIRSIQGTSAFSAG